MGIRSPFMRSIGGTPTARCTSEQPCCIPSFRNASMRATVGRFLGCYVLTQACDGEGAPSVTQCAIIREPPGVAAGTAKSPELFQGGSQLGHGLVALVLVDG